MRSKQKNAKNKAYNWISIGKKIEAKKIKEKGTEDRERATEHRNRDLNSNQLGKSPKEGGVLKRTRSGQKLLLS